MKREARLKAWQTVRKNGKWYVRGYRVDKTGQHEISFTETTFTATAERLRQLRAVLDQVRGEQLKRTEKTKMSEDKKRELKLHAIKAAKWVPEYILLRPEEKSIDGDEFFNDQSDAWEVIEPCHILSGYLPRRRPIPADVREAWAVIAMYEANQLPEYPVPAIAKAVSIAGKWLLQGGSDA